MSVDHARDFVKQQNVTYDAFLGGRLTLCQPKSGFRAGNDSVLLGASLAPDARSVADLGAGVGTAGLVAAIHNPDAGVLLVERAAGPLALAAENIAANGLSVRCTIAAIDINAPGPHRQAAGLVPDSFETVLANPPFFASGKGTPGAGKDRAAARHMPEATLDDWVRAAATIAAPRGEVIFVYPAAGLAALLAAFGARFGALTIVPVAARPGDAAGRILLRGIKGSRAPLTLLPPLVLHQAKANGFAPGPAAILRGEARLIW